MAFSAILAVFLAASAVLNFWFVSRGKVVNAVIFLFAVILFIPPEAVGLISGSPYSTSGMVNVSMAGYDALILFFCLVVTRKLHIRTISLTALIVLGCCTVIILMRLCVDGAGALSNKMVDNYLLPMLAAISMAKVLKPSEMPKLLKYIYVFILMNAAVACVELVIKQSLFFDSYYLNTVGWYKGTHNIYRTDLQFRGTALLGHPLVNGIYYVLGIVYLYNKIIPKNNVRLMIFKGVQFALLLGGIISTNSRGALLIFAVYTVVFLYTNKKIGNLLLLFMCAVILIIALDFDKIYSMMFARDVSGDSAMVRFKALEVFTKMPLETLILGEGFNKVSAVLSQYDIAGNFEISYLIIMMEIGIIGFIFWVISAITMYNPKMAKTVGDIKAKSMINGMLACFLLLAATSNSIGDPGTLNFMFWAMLAFSRVLSKEEKSSLPDNMLETNVRVF